MDRQQHSNATLCPFSPLFGQSFQRLNFFQISSKFGASYFIIFHTKFLYKISLKLIRLSLNQPSKTDFPTHVHRRWKRITWPLFSLKLFQKSSKIVTSYFIIFHTKFLYKISLKLIGLSLNRRSKWISFNAFKLLITIGNSFLRTPAG